jgi:hypothetical protein
MEPIATIEIAGAWLSIFLTLCIFSYLYEDNPIYKLAEHLFLGVSIGYGVIEIVYGVLIPNLFDKLVLAEAWTLSRIGLLAPLAMFMLLFTKFSRKYSWLARIPIAFLVAAFAGVKMTGEASARLVTQVKESMPDLAEAWNTHGFWNWEADGAGLFSSLLLVLGLSATLLHFYFSAPHNRVMRGVSRFGVLMLMLSFGASFGYTVMGRISLAIGRAQEMLGDDLNAFESAQIHPQLATGLSLLVIIAVLAVWKVRGGGQTEA